MSSEKTASAVNILKGDLAAGWNLLEGSSADYTDLGVARRFGGAAAAYSLRDIGAMNGEVVRVRREPEDTTDGIDDEEKFSANQVQDGTLERWVNGKLEDTLPADVATAAAAYSLRKVKDAPSLVYTADFSSGNDGLVPNSSLLFLNSGGQTYQGKSNVLTFTSINSPSNPQLWLNNNNFLAGFSGSITFEYYVESDSPLVGNKWVVGSSLATYTKDGVTIVGGAWTTATVFFGSYYSGTDKYKTTTGIQEVGRVLNAVDSNNQSVNCDVGEIVAFSSFTASVLSPSTQIRRSSDDIEVNVHFDSDGKISSNSLVSNVGEETTGSSSGSTTSTDLNAFLNETLTVGVAVEGGNGADRPDSFTNATNSSFTATVTEVAGGYFPYKTGAGDVVTVSFDLVLSGAASPSACTSTSVNTVNNASNTVLYTSSGSYTSSFTCTADATHFRFADGDDGTFAVTNFQVTSHTHQAFVHTWYDQAGSNDAVQATAANQPKIAESGALLADGIDFDGSNDFLESTTLSSIYTGTDEAHSSFVVVNSDVASTTQYILGIGRTSSSNPLRNTLFHSGGNIGWQVRDDAGLLKTDLSANPYVANQTYLVSALNSGTTIDFNTNSVINDNGTDADVGASTINTVKIGALAVDSSSPLNGSIKEAIFYATDQSANRFKIESNINNYYGLYNDANDK